MFFFWKHAPSILSVSLFLYIQHRPILAATTLCKRHEISTSTIHSSRRLHNLMLSAVDRIMHTHPQNKTFELKNLCNTSTSFVRSLFLSLNWQSFHFNTTNKHIIKRSLFFSSVEYVASEVTAQRAKRCSSRRKYFYDISKGLCLPVVKPKTFTNFLDPRTELIVTMSGNLLSIFSMFALLGLHCKLKISDTMMGRNLVYLCLIMMIIHGIQALSPVRQHNIIFCTISTILLHWLHIGTLVWILFASIELYMQLQRPFYYQSTSDNPSPRARLIFRIIAFTVSSIVVITCLTVNYIRSDDINQDPTDFCLPMQYWKNLLTFVIPVGLLILVNTACLVGSILRLKFDPRIKENDDDKDGERLTLTAIILQMSLIIGLSWLLGFVAKFTESESVYFAFVLTSCSKGILIYFYVICKKWIWLLYKQIYEGRKKARPKRSLTEFEVLV